MKFVAPLIYKKSFSILCNIFKIHPNFHFKYCIDSNSVLILSNVFLVVYSTRLRKLVIKFLEMIFKYSLLILVFIQGLHSRKVLGLNPVLKLRLLSQLSFVLKPYSQRVT